MCSAGCGLQRLATNWPNYGPAVCKVSKEKINTSCTPRHVSRAAGHVPRANHGGGTNEMWNIAIYRETDSAELRQPDMKYSGFCLCPGIVWLLIIIVRWLAGPGYRLHAASTSSNININYSSQECHYMTLLSNNHQWQNMCDKKGTKVFNILY